MTEREKRHIQSCRVLIVGPDEFVCVVRHDLKNLGFREVIIGSVSMLNPDKNVADIIIHYIGSGPLLTGKDNCIPTIYPFDFIKGAGVIVLFPEDDRESFCSPDIRLWSAEYMAGYCTFWNIGDLDWLLESLPLIREDKTSYQGVKTAAYMSARIVANIAVGRHVKHYPRFYLTKNISRDL
ncbi:MAG: hypothetical protein K2K45_07880 [Muribaculaceae bacterium]|nr:hypothetical protein [Muribaculaceae bacterium]